MKAIRITFRLLTSPLILAIAIIRGLYVAILATFLYLKHGGEIITYRAGDKETIANIYQQLKNNQNDTRN